MSILYEISFPKAVNHYVHVKMTIDDVRADSLEVSLPVWTPGSYLVREYAQHIESLKVKNASGKPLDVHKADKNTWRIRTGSSRKVVVEYTIYCFDATVRTNFVDADHATLIGANTFLYVEGARDLPAVLHFKPREEWKDIATSLPVQGSDKWVRTAEDYDFIVDNPIEIGNLKFYEFKAGGVPHTLAVFGESNADMDQLVEDLEKTCKEQIRMFGDNPCDHYLFILLMTENRYNGLEHLHCSLNQLPRWDFSPRDRYQRSMGLLSHEYFHLWNVKRIRPVELSRVDYNTEVYTRQLWVAEGVTSYYDDYFLYRVGVFNRQEYLDAVAKMLNGVVNTPGDTLQSLTESSHDAWIKYYRKNENTDNNQVSYYYKGAMIIHVLNLMILNESKGKHSFDDVMRQLWADYKQRPDEGYTEAEFLAVVEKFAGMELDAFFQRHIYGTEPLDYAAYFAYAGLDLVDENAGKDTVLLGMTSKWDDGKLLVTKVNRRYGAYAGGLNVNDEIIAVDGYRVKKGWEKFYADKKVGDTIEILVDRQGEIRSLSVPLTAGREVKYKLVPKEKPGKNAGQVRAAWLGVL